jgi:hypothetical protein
VKYREYKYPTCDGVRAVIPPSDAVAQDASINQYCKSHGRPQTTSIDHYNRCSIWGAPEGFVRAGPGDAPVGCTIQGAMVPGFNP